MPKIDTPDVKKGFWLAIGVILAFIVLGLIRMVLSSARKKTGG